VQKKMILKIIYFHYPPIAANGFLNLKIDEEVSSGFFLAGKLVGFSLTGS
jgi:hypothetical protein